MERGTGLLSWNIEITVVLLRQDNPVPEKVASLPFYFLAGKKGIHLKELLNQPTYIRSYINLEIKWAINKTRE